MFRIFRKPVAPQANVARTVAASDTLKRYDVCRKISERGAFIVQERSVVVDQVDAVSMESATAIVRKNYGEGAYVVLVIGD